jgi:hypothetical protein
MSGFMPNEPAPLSTVVRVMLTIWCIILVAGSLSGLMLTGMAFEGGHTLDAYLALIAVWSYPVLVGLAFFYRRRRPLFVWLPSLTGVLFLIEKIVWLIGVRVTFD